MSLKTRKEEAKKTKALPMEIGEIVTDYRHAKNKDAQIGILADLCGVDECRIAWILKRCGLEVNPKKMPRALRNENSFDYVAFWEQSDDAKKCDEIRLRREAMELEAELKKRKEAQSMPEFDAAEEPASAKTEPASAKTETASSETGTKTAEAEKSMEITEGDIDTMGECELLPFERDEKSCGDLRREILQEAEACVCSDRNLSYGEPEDNFAVIADLWTGYLNGLLHTEGGISLCSEEVADMMILFKVARNATAVRRKRDTYVDIAGYAACAGALIE